MDPYIRDFKVNTIKTEIVSNCDECNKVLEINEHNCNIKLLHNNIRSIGKNLEEFKCYIRQFTTEIECIVLTETWQVQDLDLCHMDGYNIVYNEGTFNQNDGVIIYIKSDLVYTYEIIQLPNDNKVIQLRLNHNNKKIIINAAYRSPSSCPLEFIANIKYLLQNCKNVDYSVFVGDINIDILKNTDISLEYLNTMHEYGYVSTINDYTRCKDLSKTCIDHIFIKTNNSDAELLLPIIIKTTLTDHYMILLQIIFSNMKMTPKKENFNVIQKINYDKLKTNLNNVDWNCIYQLEELESATNRFIYIINENIISCTQNVKIKNKKRKSWITNGIINSINRRDKMYQQLLREPNNDILMLNYKKYRNLVTSLIKKAKIDHYKEKIEQNKNSTKNLWSTVKEICSTTTKNNCNISTINSDSGEKIVDTKSIANIFNNTYIRTGGKLANEINKDPYYRPKKVNSVNSIFLSATNSAEVKEMIMSLKKYKAPGIDGLKAETLKNISSSVSEPLAHIINRCIETGYCPSAFKTSVVLPIHKNGDRMVVTNYRPISLITCYTKIFEQIIKKRLTAYINKYNLLSNSQYGFREGISTQDAILHVTALMYAALDRGEPSLCVFIDLSKAFDTVGHSLLVESLEEIGIRGKSLDLFKSYISNRKQCVKINNVLSDYKQIEYGVPQGSVLGPILFNIYLNGLFSVQSGGTIITYADDTAIFYRSKNWESLKIKVESDMKKIKDWFDYKSLTINLNKTVYLPITCNKTTIPQFQNLNIDNRFIIQAVTKVKYLGVWLDAHLKWDSHINYIIKKIQYLIYKFKTLRDILDLKHLKTLYYALIESHINYGILAWGGAGKTYLNNLIIVQKRILKVIFNKNHTYPSDALYGETAIMDPRQLFYLHSSIRLHLNETTLEKNDHAYDTRKKNLTYLPPLMNKAIGQKSFTYLGPKLYNMLPRELSNIKSKYAFKKQLKKYILSIPRHEVHDIIECK